MIHKPKREGIIHILADFPFVFYLPETQECFLQLLLSCQKDVHGRSFFLSVYIKQTKHTKAMRI